MGIKVGVGLETLEQVFEGVKNGGAGRSSISLTSTPLLLLSGKTIQRHLVPSVPKRKVRVQDKKNRLHKSRIFFGVHHGTDCFS